MTAGDAKIDLTTVSPESPNDGQKKILRVAVGSKNPVKVNAVKRAMQSVVKLSHLEIDVEVQGFDVPSEVSDQPFGDEETQLGAKTRAENAYQAFKETNDIYPHLAVGLEGGLERSSTIQDAHDGETLWCMAWMAIYGKRTTHLVECLASTDSKFYSADKTPICCLSKTGTFLLPSSLVHLIVSGMELSHADDAVFGRVNSKQKSGTVGILTNGLVDRTAYYEQALILALLPWIRPDVYSAPAQNNPSDYDGEEVQEQETDESTETETTSSSSLLGSLFCLSRKS